MSGRLVRTASKSIFVQSSEGEHKDNEVALRQGTLRLLLAKWIEISHVM